MSMVVVIVVVMTVVMVLCVWEGVRAHVSGDGSANCGCYDSCSRLVVGIMVIMLVDVILSVWLGVGDLVSGDGSGRYDCGCGPACLVRRWGSYYGMVVAIVVVRCLVCVCVPG